MCKMGNTEIVMIKNRAGELIGRDIDSCLVPMVKALNNAGLTTGGCCCGHGNQPASIILADGTHIIMTKDVEVFQEVCSLYPPIIGEEGEDINYLESQAMTSAKRTSKKYDKLFKKTMENFLSHD